MVDKLLPDIPETSEEATADQDKTFNFAISPSFFNKGTKCLEPLNV